MQQIELSFVVPAYNEERYIEDMLESLDAVIADKKLPYEIVVVDDGSKDRTLINARRYARRNTHVRVVTYSENVGKGHAVKTGFLNSYGDIVIFADSDLEIDLTVISDYIEALNYGDIAIASKKHRLSNANVPMSRRILSEVFNRLVRILTGVPLKDTQSGLKAMRKSAFVDIFPRLAVKRYAFDVELLAVANQFGLKVVEMPVNIRLKAKFKPKEMWHMLVDLLGIAYRLRIIHWYQRPITRKDKLMKHESFFSEIA
jgi:glycosyltransferase involved in cell wall biosynthesis